MAFRKGEKRPAKAGRRKGTPNKATADVKAALLEAFEKRGGVKELVALKEETFYALFGKIIPRELKAEIAGDIRLKLTRSFVKDADGQEKS